LHHRKEGWPREQEKYRKASADSADGVREPYE